MKRLFSCLGFLFLFFVFVHSPVHAEDISSFQSIVTVHQNGSLTVTEHIVYDFGTTPHHGIYRTIPLISQVGNLYKEENITLQEVTQDDQPANYTVDNSNQTLNIKIGDPNQTISGSHSYVLFYQVSNATTTYSDHDELFWNVTGNDWQVPVLNSTAILDFDAIALPTRYACYTGLYGSRSSNCTINTQISPKQVSTTIPLSAGEGLSVVMAFPAHSFPPSILSTTSPTNSVTTSLSPQTAKFFAIGLLLLLGLLNLVVPMILGLWYLTHKHKNRFGKPAVNFDLPKDKQGNRIAPAEAGTIDTSYLDRNDVTATIFDLAIRKYIKMQANDKKGLFGTTQHEIILKKLKSYNSSVVTPFEKVLLDRLFADGDSVDLSDLRSDFYLTFKKIGTSVFESLVAKGFYTKNPANQRTGLIVFAIFSLFLGGLLTFVMLLILAIKLNGRTQQGDEIDWRIDGLKLFLKGMERNYKWQADQLYIVEKMIPYAIALGYIDKFMEQLKISYPNYNPSWYAGNNGFYVFYPAMFSTFNSSFVSVAPSSSSGFSGGGFSGGGGGGGGGGSW